MRAPSRRSFRRGAITALALGALASSVAPAAGADARDRIEEARRRGAFPVAVGYDFDYAGVPDNLAPGTYDFTFVNASRTEEHELVLFKLGSGNEDSTVDEVVAAADREDEAFFNDFRGVSFAEPLSVQRPEETEFGFVGRADLSEAGRYVYICFVPENETGRPHYQLGMLGFLEVE